MMYMTDSGRPVSWIQDYDEGVITTGMLHYVTKPTGFLELALKVEIACALGPQSTLTSRHLDCLDRLYRLNFILDMA